MSGAPVVAKFRPGPATARVLRNTRWDAMLCTTGQHLARGLAAGFSEFETGHDIAAPDYLPAGACDGDDVARILGMAIVMRGAS